MTRTLVLSAMFVMTLINSLHCKCVPNSNKKFNENKFFLISEFFWLVVASQGPVAQALFLGDQNLFNTTRDDCVWKRGNDRDHCPDEDISMILYTSKKTKLKVN